MNKPTFFIIGAAKSGTSTVYRYLLRHSNIFMSKWKEPQYYSDDSLYLHQADWYSSLYSNASLKQICGEASTTYSRYPHTPDVPGRIFQDHPSAKIIYILRHPVVRAYSHYCHHMREGVTATFEEAIATNSIYVDCSLYIEQIERYMRYFQRDQILVLFFDELMLDPQRFLDKIMRFLLINREDLIRQGKIFANKSGVDHYVRLNTVKKLRKFALIDTAANSTPQILKDFIFLMIKQLPLVKKIAQEISYPKMHFNTRDKLLEYFKPYNHRLETFIGFKIPSWEEYEL